MYENPEFNAKGEKILCEEKGKNSHMLMDVRVQKLAAGQKVRLLEQDGRGTAVCGNQHGGRGGTILQCLRHAASVDQPEPLLRPALPGRLR